LRVIILGLKMSSLAFVEADALDEIRSRIKNLPSPETLNNLAETPRSLKEVRRDIGEIMEMINAYSQRDGEFKARYKSRTGLPPRYKVLEWKDMMQQNANNLVRQLIKISASIDEVDEDISKDLIECAKCIRVKQDVRPELELTIGRLSREGFSEAVKSIREAQSFMGKMKQMMGGQAAPGGERISNEQKFVSQMGKEFANVIARFEQSLNTDNLLKDMERMQNWVAKVNAMQDPVAKAQAQPLANYMKKLWADAKQFNQQSVQRYETFAQQARASFNEVAQGVAQAPVEGQEGAAGEEAAEGPAQQLQQEFPEGQRVVFKSEDKDITGQIGSITSDGKLNVVTPQGDMVVDPEANQVQKM